VDNGADIQGNKDALKVAYESGNKKVIKYLVEHGDVKRNKIVNFYYY